MSGDLLRLEGPIVDGEVADPDRSDSEPLALRFLIDTGAALSVVPRDVIDALGRRRERELEITGVVPRSFVRCPVFKVLLRVGGMAFEVEVAALERDGDAAGGILGRDVLSHLRFTYDGPLGIFALDSG